MNLPTIAMEPADARVALEAYRADVAAYTAAELRRTRGHHGSKRETAARLARIDAAVMETYGAISKGRPVFRLEDAIRAGGVDGEHRPRLAIARADETRVRMWADRQGAVQFTGPASRDVVGSSRIFRLPAGTLPTWTGQPWPPSATAIVPTIPPRYRPAAANLSAYAIIWEADWRAVPRDPALLRPLGRGLYAVLAVWDLTEVERLALGMVGAG